MRDSSWREARLSRTMSHALRHEPWLYELELDDEGWTPVADLLAALDVSREQLEVVVRDNPKQRFELSGDRVRARYGHSVPGRIVRVPALPPVTLFHGTSAVTASLVLTEGLRPMRRQYVHLSVTREMAESVGRRKGTRVRVLTVDTAAARAAGVEFLRGNEFVWLAEHVPAAFLT
ncbi:RNA 2'-phosphotransferase [Actinophytocola oryzae]|uniref:Probable RNA 2'-phosphotransferase n=1 Tax=Actinophytocola oryzae TaxID=502181 RepID=A0A4R7VQB8_9PSEU|nr:RNA 2'-phosphotransferase [Actinophytocola oryzae]TDV51943.1 putative RNA 2'-phosphotransferase [Actinophytocola oryzae]